MTMKTEILVLGGGYAGVMASLRIAGKTKKGNVRVTIVNAHDTFIERPRLHEKATGTKIKGKPIVEMIKGRPINFIEGWVEAVLPDENGVRVKTAVSTLTIPYDILVNALGSRVERHKVKGVAQFAYTLDPYGRLTTDDLKTRLEQFGERPFQASVIGGGATGVEMVTQLKSNYPACQATIITQGKVGNFKDAVVRNHIQQALTEQNITTIEHSRVLEVVANGVMLQSGKVGANVIIWAGGFTASPIAKEAGIAVNAFNQMRVDPQLRSISHPNIYAVGDAAAPIEEPGAPMRMSLFTAVVSGAQAADNIVALIKGKEQKPLSFAWYGQGIALGKTDAVGFATYPVDTRSGPILRRKTAVAVRNFFVWYLKFTLEMERRIPGFLFWNGKKRYGKQQQKRIQAQHQP